MHFDVVILRKCSEREDERFDSLQTNIRERLHRIGDFALQAEEGGVDEPEDLRRHADILPDDLPDLVNGGPRILQALQHLLVERRQTRHRSIRATNA